MSAATRLMRNSALSLVTNIVTKAINTLAFILIARSLGTDPAGIFSLSTTYLIFFSATTLGLGELLVRQVARDRGQSNQYFSLFLTLQFVLTGIAYGLYFLLVRRIMPYAPSTSLPLLVMGLSFIPDSLSNIGQSLLAAHERFDTPLIAGLFSSLIKAAGIIWALYSGAELGKLLLSGSLGTSNPGTNPALLQIGVAWFAGACLGAAIILYKAASMSGRLSLAIWLNHEFWTQNLRLSLPFLTIGFLLTVEFQTDVIILSAVRDEREVGLYGAATTITFALTILSQAFRAAVYPLMARYHKTAPERLGRIYDLSTFYLGSLALPMTIGLTLLARPVIILLYKSSFEGAVLPLQIIIWLLFFNFLNVPNSRLMLVNEKQNTLTWMLIGSMGLNILLNLLLDSSMGAVGASIARVTSSGLFFLVNFGFVKRHLHAFSLTKTLSKPLIASGIMMATVWLIQSSPIPPTWNLWAAIFSGILVYLGSLLILRGLSPEERLWLHDLADWASARFSP